MSSSAVDVAASKNRTKIYSSPLFTSSSSSSEIDAGLNSSKYYKQRLPLWRYYLRQKLLHLIQLETPYLAWMQDKMRSSVLDSYFSITANLGTHTFFMIVLPILFWCGYTSLGRGMVHILALGVISTGLLKDMLALPRPAAPPLHRITMSRSAALEYGFPSTHSANAVSIAVFIILKLQSSSYQLQYSTKLFSEAIACFYALTIIVGRLYCGMHGFIDVAIGSVIGAALSTVEYAYGAGTDRFLLKSTWITQAVIVLAIITFIRIHPKSADNCPCFDDTIAFAGVMIGVEVGGWRYANGNWASDVPGPGTVPFDLARMGWSIAILRIVTGTVVIFAWRAAIKPIMLKLLPHLFRLINEYDMVPRRYFKPAPQSKSILLCSKEKYSFPLASSLLCPSETRHLDKEQSTMTVQSAVDCQIESNGNYEFMYKIWSSLSTSRRRLQALPYFHRVIKHLHFLSNLAPVNESLIRERNLRNNSYMHGKKMSLDSELSFARYNVDVITKILVYTGIGWLSVETNPIIFELIGLGLGRELK